MQYLNLEQYPLHLPGTPAYAALVHQCQDDLANQGMFNLNGFVPPAVVDQILSEVQPLVDEVSFVHKRQHNVFFLPTLEDIGPDHPAAQEFETSNRPVCGDQLSHCPLTDIYSWPPLANFIAAVMGKPALYIMDDEIARLNVMDYGPGQALNWHFDRSEFTTTLLLQAPTEGGEFEYQAGLRTDESTDYEALGKFLNDPQGATRLQLSAGTLNVFRGRNTLHRVAPVLGNQHRIIAILSYFERPGVRFSTAENQGFYGRSESLT